MKENIKEYAKVGFVHHMLYPKCTEDADYHVDTLKSFVGRPDIESLDCCIPYGEERRKSVMPVVRNCGKDVGYALHLFPARKISLASLDIQEQALTRLVIAEQIKLAADIGATGFVFVSGADIPDNRPAAQKAFKTFCRWFCSELQKYKITALLEPFDRTVDKKFLYGPIDDCVRLADEISQEYDNFGIELDMGHLPLMSEDFNSAVQRCGRHIKRIHLGNCILKNKSNPLYGDYHPPMGIEDGENDIPELAAFLKALLEIGYLSKTGRKPLLIETRPYPGNTVEYTIDDAMNRLDAAWKLV